MTEYLYTIFALLPFMVSLVSLVVYLVAYKSLRAPQRVLILFIVACLILYFFHGWYNLADKKVPMWADTMYLFGALSVYPLFYCYVSVLTRDRMDWRMLANAVSPAVLLSVLAHATGWDRTVYMICKAVFVAEILQVAVLGMRDIRRFDDQVKNFYSDTEGKTLRRIYVLLICIAVIATLSLASTLTGRGLFRNSMMICIPSVLFSTLLFGVFYTGYSISFSARDFASETSEEDAGPASEPADASLEARIASEMESRKLFLVPGLKISDVAAVVGSNRSYVSKAINDVAGMSFSDYVNSRRVEYAKKRLAEAGGEDELSIAGIASESGFASFPSFYRSFTKFVGMSPTAWIKQNKG